MKLLITGASGFIGGRFLDIFGKDFETIGTYFSNQKPGLEQLDLTDKEKVLSFFDRYKPEIVFHSAALPNVNRCESDREEAIQKNLTATQNITDASKLHNAKVIFLSSDYVFDGEDGPYAEDAPTNPLNHYGSLKLESENYIKNNLDKYLIIRTTNVYGFDPNSKNFLMFAIAKFSNNEPLSVAVDQYGNPTLVEDLCSTIKELIDKDKVGVFNVAGPQLMNRLEWTRAFADVFGFNQSLISGSVTDNLAQAAKRPLKSGFITTKIKNELSYRMRNTREGLMFMKKMRDEFQDKGSDQT
ncbi:SDR family oxidoreductase [Candidatus Woesearchaeota archaeon]|nr:SDR family oxidoreductase [Candidatus Woesearchaeota archaeon]